MSPKDPNFMKLSGNERVLKALETLEERRSSRNYGIKLMVFIVLLSFLLSETAILAYENVSLLNGTNLSEYSSINTSPMTESSSNNSPQISNIINQTFMENSTSNEKDINESFENETNTTGNLTDENETQNFVFSAMPESNETENRTVENETGPIVVFDPIPVLTENNTKLVDNKFSIILNYPAKVTRGEQIIVSATAENIDFIDVEGVFLEWDIPAGFELVSGEIIKDCGLVPMAGSCRSEIGLKPSLSTVLGIHKIDILVHYEE